MVVLFLAFDGVTQVIQESHVIAASADLGFSVSSIAGIGALLLGLTLGYAIPRTSILGAVLPTGYLGGAVAVQVRVGHPAFECAFPVIVGARVWPGLMLRDASLREIMRKTLATHASE
jgi:DoxX-like family